MSSRGQVSASVKGLLQNYTHTHELRPLLWVAHRMTRRKNSERVMFRFRVVPLSLNTTKKRRLLLKYVEKLSHFGLKCDRTYSGMVYQIYNIRHTCVELSRMMTSGWFIVNEMVMKILRLHQK